MEPTLAILISGASLRDGEASVLSDLFETGLQRLHLRKPDCKPTEVAQLLSRIPEVYHSRIVMHRFPELLKEFDLAGYHHFTSEKLIQCKGTISRSLHTLDELKEIKEPLDYCFFGPVFESISKKGYVPKVSLPELGAVLYNFKKSKSKKPLVYALGGVRRRRFLNCSTLVLMELLSSDRFGGKKILLLLLRDISLLSVVSGPKERNRKEYFTGC